MNAKSNKKKPEFVLECPKCRARTIQNAQRNRKTKKGMCAREHVIRRLNIIGKVLGTNNRTNSVKIAWI